MLQIKKRRDGKIGIRFMPTICFYQDTWHEKTLLWIQDVLGIGYLSRRKDDMTELRINGYSRIKNILKNLLPYIRFKKVQGTALLLACEILSTTKFVNLREAQLRKLVNLVLVIQKENYVTRHKRTKTE